MMTHFIARSSTISLSVRPFIGKTESSWDLISFRGGQPCRNHATALHRKERNPRELHAGESDRHPSLRRWERSFASIPPAARRARQATFRSRQVISTTGSTTSARSYAASGITAGQRIVSTYNAGPFVAGAALGSMDKIGLCHIPVGTGNTERLMTAIKLLKPEAAVLTPSYAAYLIEWAAERNFDLKGSSVKRVLVAGEPGGGEPAFRHKLEEGWGARVTEAMGIGDIGVSLWGECETSMRHASRCARLCSCGADRSRTGQVIAMEDGATWRTCSYPSPAPRRTTVCASARATMWRYGPAPANAGVPHHACAASAAPMTCLIVRGVNVFPSAIREVVSEFAPEVSGHILVKPIAGGRQAGATAATRD